MEIKVLCAKDISDNPSDGIGNFIKSVFGKMDDLTLSFYVRTPRDFKDAGVIRSFLGSKLGFLIGKKPEYLWGIGHARELFLALLKPKKTKYFINFHTILLRGNGPWKVRTPWWLRKLLFSKADKIICPSEFSAKSVRKHFPEKNIVSILNGVDAEFFNPSKKNRRYLAEKYGLNFSKPTVVFAGTLEPRKRPDLFINIAKSYGKANFVMVGRRVPPDDFLSAVLPSNNLFWIEKMSREDIAVLFASSEMFVFPSLNEPSAAVILEAMASGCVPILSASGGNGEFLESGKEGCLVPVNEKEKENFLKNIDAFVTDGDLLARMSRAARKCAEEHNARKTAIQYRGLFGVGF
jgi:glycosyltransferase involved in cell wall biosynthesis